MSTCFIEFFKLVGEKEIKCEACRAFNHFIARSLTISLIQEYLRMLDSINHMKLKVI